MLSRKSNYVRLDFEISLQSLLLYELFFFRNNQLQKMINDQFTYKTLIMYNFFHQITYLQLNNRKI